MEGSGRVPESSIPRFGELPDIIPFLIKSEALGARFLHILPSRSRAVRLWDSWLLLRCSGTLTKRFDMLMRGNFSMPIFNALLRDEAGATAIEYALIASLVSMVIIASLNMVGSSLIATFEKVAAAFP
jgi:pilus assembly protein Flp/PilA